MGVLILVSNQLTEVKEEQVAKAKEAVIKVAKQLDDRLKIELVLGGTQPDDRRRQCLLQLDRGSFAAVEVIQRAEQPAPLGQVHRLHTHPLILY